MTLNDQLGCAQRELALRKRVYPRWVDGGKMAPERADHELACMEAIVATLQKLVWLAEVSEEMRAQYRAEHGLSPEQPEPCTNTTVATVAPMAARQTTPEPSTPDLPLH